jgi:hypothetical protein
VPDTARQGHSPPLRLSNGHSVKHVSLTEPSTLVPRLTGGGTSFALLALLRTNPRTSAPCSLRSPFPRRPRPSPTPPRFRATGRSANDKRRAWPFVISTFRIAASSQGRSGTPPPPPPGMLLLAGLCPDNWRAYRTGTTILLVEWEAHLRSERMERTDAGQRGKADLFGRLQDRAQESCRAPGWLSDAECDLEKQ